MLLVRPFPTRRHPRGHPELCVLVIAALPSSALPGQLPPSLHNHQTPYYRISVHLPPQGSGLWQAAPVKYSSHSDALRAQYPVFFVLLQLFISVSHPAETEAPGCFPARFPSPDPGVYSLDLQAAEDKV